MRLLGIKKCAIYLFLLCMTFIFVAVWRYDQWKFKLSRIEVRIDQLLSKAKKSPITNESSELLSNEINTNIQFASKDGNTGNVFSYEEPPIAGNGSYDEEIRRYNIHVSTQGVVCQNIKHFGGRYRKNYDPPQSDPDGLWYLCLDPEVKMRPGSCIVYSIGINNEWSFDDSIANYGCRVYAFDPSMKQNDHFRSERIQFFKVGLSDVDFEGKPGESGKAAWKTRTLKSIIKDLHHDNQSIDVLKIDIETYEWRSLPQMLSDGTLLKYVKQLDVEFHVYHRNTTGVRRYYGIAKWLDRQGFKIAYMHKNMYCRACYEVTYINTNLIKLPLTAIDYESVTV